MQTKKINTKLWRNQNLPGIDLSKSQYSSHQFKPHFHEHYVIQLVTKGINEGKCEHKNYQIQTKEIIIINPGEIHTGYSMGNQILEYVCLCPTVVFFKNIYSDNNISIDYTPIFKNTPIADNILTKKFQQLFLLSTNNSNRLAIELATTDLFGYLIRNYSRHQVLPAPLKNEKKRIKKAKEFISENFNRNFSLRELSNYVLASPFYLIRTFKKETGMTPFEYLRNFRIEKAKALLREKKSIMDATHCTGFYDQSHFIRHFKTITGLTPKAYV